MSDIDKLAADIAASVEPEPTDWTRKLIRLGLEAGMKREWFQDTKFPHYDVSLERRKAAIKLGAVEVDRREIVALMQKIRTNSNLKQL